MSLNRWARKADTSQPAIVDELKACGVDVVVIGKPVDLLCRLRGSPSNTWRLIEVKTATKTGKLPSVDKRQKDQTKFCIDYNVPFCTTTEQVLEYLRTR